MSIETFKIIVTSRIEKQKADEAVRIKADTARIRAEEEAKATAKAQAEAEAILAAERAKQAAEEAAEREAMQREHDKALTGEPAVIQAAITNTPPESQTGTLAGARPAAASQMEPAAPDVISLCERCARPNDKEIINAVSSAFDVSFGTACDYIREVADSLEVAA